MRRNYAEALVTEYVQEFLHGKCTYRAAQSLCKHCPSLGGGWMRVCAQATELDFHILRAIIGMHFETPVNAKSMQAPP